MHAVIETGGKQYRVCEGQTIKVEKLAVEPGKKVNFNNVLLISDGEKVKIGTPYVDGCEVTAEVVEHGRGKKINIIKFKRRKHHMKHMGHRQDYTAIKITGIK